MLQNGRVAAFTVSELLRENPKGRIIKGKTTGGGVKKLPPPTQIRVKTINNFYLIYLILKLLPRNKLSISGYLFNFIFQTSLYLYM